MTPDPDDYMRHRNAAAKGGHVLLTTDAQGKTVAIVGDQEIPLDERATNLGETPLVLARVSSDLGAFKAAERALAKGDAVFGDNFYIPGAQEPVRQIRPAPVSKHRGGWMPPKVRKKR
jgi:hypothetical protein